VERVLVIVTVESATSAAMSHLIDFTSNAKALILLLQSSSDEPGSSAVDRVPAPDSGSPAGLFGKYALLFVADIASRGLRFFADIVLVRHFGPAIFGQLNVAQSLAVQGMS